MKLEQMKVVTTKQGTRLAHLPDDTKYITLRVILPVGYGEDVKDENFNYWGKAHIIEHLIVNKYIKELRPFEDCIILCDASTDKQITEYVLCVKQEAFNKIYPALIESLSNYKIDANQLEQEIEIINIEGELSDCEDGLIPDAEFFSRTKRPKGKNLDITSKSQKLREEHSDIETLQNFYNQHYQPNRFVFSMLGGTSEDFDNFVKFVEQYYSSAPEQLPHTIDLKMDEEDQAFALPSNKKYSVVNHKYQKGQGTRVTVYFHSASQGTHGHRVAQLYQFFLEGSADNYVSCLFSPLDKMLVNNLRCAYDRRMDFVIDPRDNKKYLVFHVGTIQSRLTDALVGLRTLINLTADKKNHNRQIFEQTKQKFLQSHYNAIISAPDQYMQVIEEYLLSGKPITTYQQFVDQINAVSYEDFVKYSKYIATTNRFKVRACGKQLTEDMLHVFETQHQQSITHNTIQPQNAMQARNTKTKQQQKDNQIEM